jgi:hypothetical protein
MNSPNEEVKGKVSVVFRLRILGTVLPIPVSSFQQVIRYQPRNPQSSSSSSAFSTTLPLLDFLICGSSVLKLCTLFFFFQSIL